MFHHINPDGHAPFSNELEVAQWSLSESKIKDAFEKAVLSQVYVHGADKNVLPPPSPSTSFSKERDPSQLVTPSDGETPLFIRNPQPPYPPQALQMHITGDVRVSISISNGHIADVRTVSGPAVLATAAAKWIAAKWKPAPNTNGTFTKTIVFQISGPRR